MIQLLPKLRNKIFYSKAKYSNPKFYISEYFCISKNKERLKKFNNKYTGKRCFIIGNGPSLNKIDISLMKNEYTFGVNAIYTNYDKMGFYPTFWAIEDILVAEDRGKEISEFKGSVKFYGAYLNKFITKDEMTIYINFVQKSIYNDFPKFSKDAFRIIYFGGTVSYLCMQLAYYMGFSEVYLVGFDHNYTIPKEAIVRGAEILSTSDDPNHFSPTYFGKGKRWHDPKVERMELSYRKAKISFEESGKKIYNATFGGQLEVFERRDYHSLF